MKNIRTLCIAVAVLSSAISVNAQALNNDLAAVDTKCLVASPAIHDTMANAAKQPASVTDFSGMKSDNSVILTWSTETGFTAASFIIEKSMDGRNWQAMAAVEASTNTATPCVYYYGDTKPFATSYYRLKPVDNDGAGAYTSVLQVGTAAKVKQHKK